MRSELYRILNEMDHKAESYGNERPETKEVRRWMENVTGKKRRSFRTPCKYAAAILAVALAGSCLAAPGQVYAGVKAVTYSISRMLGIQKDISPYKTVVGKSVSGNGVTVTLNEVILDEELIYISDTTTFQEPEEAGRDEIQLADETVYVNGRMASVAGGGTAERADDYSTVALREVEIPGVDTDGELDVEIVYTMEGKRIGSIAFRASGAELRGDTKSVSLNVCRTLPDGTSLCLERYTSSRMAQRIYFEASPHRLDYMVTLKGKDDLGNPVEFGLRVFDERGGRMEVETLKNGQIREDAKSLSLTLYAAEQSEEGGRENRDYQKIGEPFEISLE